jgi:hypothetical protein
MPDRGLGAEGFDQRWVLLGKMLYISSCLPMGLNDQGLYLSVLSDQWALGTGNHISDTSP